MPLPFVAIDSCAEHPVYQEEAIDILFLPHRPFLWQPAEAHLRLTTFLYCTTRSATFNHLKGGLTDIKAVPSHALVRVGSGQLRVMAMSRLSGTCCSIIFVTWSLVPFMLSHPGGINSFIRSATFLRGAVALGKKNDRQGHIL
jgi:hypothetical protein